VTLLTTSLRLSMRTMNSLEVLMLVVIG
jgi:hypothetical protein